MDRQMVSLITGGAGGICLDVALRLAQVNRHVVVIDKDVAALNELRDRKLGNVTLVHMDVERETDVRELFGSLKRADLLPDILINGVGGDARRISFGQLTESDLAASLRQNLFTAFSMCRYALPHMVEKGHGRIVNFTSVAGRTYTIFSNTAYVCAKASIIGLTKQLAYEFAENGITVNAVAHGPIATPRIQAAWDSKSDAEKQRILAEIPLGRLGTVDEAAAIVTHLCSRESGYTTGSIIDINGGLHI